MDERVFNKILSIEDELFPILGDREGGIPVNRDVLGKAMYHNMLLRYLETDSGNSNGIKRRYERLSGLLSGRCTPTSDDEIPLVVSFMNVFILFIDMKEFSKVGMSFKGINVYSKSGIATGIVA